VTGEEDEGANETTIPLGAPLLAAPTLFVAIRLCHPLDLPCRRRRPPLGRSVSLPGPCRTDSDIRPLLGVSRQQRARGIRSSRPAYSCSSPGDCRPTATPGRVRRDPKPRGHQPLHPPLTPPPGGNTGGTRRFTSRPRRTRVHGASTPRPRVRGSRVPSLSAGSTCRTPGCRRSAAVACRRARRRPVRQGGSGSCVIRRRPRS